MSQLKYSGVTHTIEFVSSPGVVLGRWTAYNNIDRAYANKHE